MTNRSPWLSPRRLLAFVAGCTAIVFVTAWLLSSKPAVEVRSRESSYEVDVAGSVRSDRFAGSPTCRECHASESEAWESHPMFHSTRLLSERNEEDEDFSSPTFSPSAHLTYTVEKRGSELFHHEVMTDSAGEILYDQSEQVQVVVGSGQQGHAYLIQRSGLLFASPINWYSRSGTWGLAPGYNPHSHNRFERRVTDACINCHVGRPAEDSSAKDRFRQPMFEEAGIGCERCHGPSADHISHHKGMGISDAIVNPSKLSYSQRDAVCNQCHLQGLERVLRPGRSEYDFRPGMHLNDVWSIFVRDAQHTAKASRAVSHVEQMQASRCYVESNGMMGCTSCHDAHAANHGEQSWMSYRLSCLNCHEVKSCTGDETARAARNDSCVDCHMTTNSASDVPHAAHTDHRVLRTPLADSSHAVAIGSQDINIFRETGAARLSKPEEDRSRGIAMARMLERGEASHSGAAATAEVLLRRARKSYPDDPDLLECLGMALEHQDREFEASIVWKNGLKVDPDNESILFRLAKLSHDSGDLPAAAKYLEDFLKLNPWHAGVFGRHAHVLGLQGRLAEGIKSAEKALQLDPSLIQVRGWLIEAYRSTGQKELQNQQQKLYDRMLPITGLPDETDRPG